MTYLTKTEMLDREYARLRIRGRIEPHEYATHCRSERDFGNWLSMLRARAAKDGYRVYTCSRAVPIEDRMFELHSVPSRRGKRHKIVVHPQGYDACPCHHGRSTLVRPDEYPTCGCHCRGGCAGYLNPCERRCAEHGDMRWAS